MSRPAIFVTKRLPSSVLDELAARASLEVWKDPSGPSPEELVEQAASCTGIISQPTDRVDAALLDRAPELRIVANVAVGYDNVDVTAARERRVIVTNTPDVLTECCAAYTWGLILTATRRIAEGDRLARRGAWEGWAIDFMLGCEISGRQLGIVGMGRIGRAVAAKAGCFGMRVAYAPSRANTADLPLAPDGTPYTPMSLDQLLVTSDVVSLHLPLRPETRHLIDAKALARMKRSAFLVNMARGPVVDEAALAWALREGLISGAALDVYENEPTIHPDLFGLEQVVLAPHLGSATRETRTAMADLAVRNVLAVIDGQLPLTPVPGSFVGQGI
ncbi:MAG: D-glycerate dehydrogenase [Luteitalea sp.]|nr:D-glycerate dehydrogenase [Luteitalea sp.]